MSRGYTKTAKESKGEDTRGQAALPLTRKEVRKMLLAGATALALDLGVAALVGAIDDEVDERCGRRGKRQSGRQAYRYGRQPGYIVAFGQKLSVERPRVRTADGRREVELETYRALQTEDQLTEDVLRRLLRGVSCRDYRGVIEAAPAGFAASRTSVSRRFMRAAGQALEAFRTRRLDEPYIVVYVDGVHFKGEVLVVALGVTMDGQKRVLGLRQGSTENARLCKDLLADLCERGLDPAQPRLWVIDGAKALRKAIGDVFGERAFVQRCQIHKTRNVKGYLSDKLAADVTARLRAAYSAPTYAEAHKILTTTLRWLERVAPDAARSLRDGLDETLTILRLGVPEPLRRALASTNPLESLFDNAQTQIKRVKHWRGGDMRLRWGAAGLLRAEGRSHRVKGYRHLPALAQAMAALLDRQLDTTKNAA